MTHQPVYGDDDRFVHFVADDPSDEDLSLASWLAHSLFTSISDPQKFPFSQERFDAGDGFAQLGDAMGALHDPFADGFLLSQVEQLPISVLQLLHQFGIAHLTEAG
jgi:hypothetical protein